MKLVFASDHRGLELKNKLIDALKNNNEIFDVGTYTEESCDYPVYAYKLGKKIRNKEADFGIAICGSGIGISIACNKQKGIYCAKVSNKEEALHTRLDNNTNVIAFGEKMDFSSALESVNTFINTEFSNLDKHIRRINEVKDIEEGTYNG